MRFFAASPLSQSALLENEKRIFLRGNLHVSLLPVEIIPNFDRNETIDLEGNKDRGKVTDENPWRWWKNDDDDDPNKEHVGDDAPGASSPDYQSGDVDGTRDLADFFPLYFDIKKMVEVLPPDTHTYKLKQADGALNFVYTNLTALQADDFLIEDLQEYGSNFDQLANEAPTVHITSSGVDLSSNFLNKIKDEIDKGVLLFEGRENTTNPLVLEVYKGGNKIAEFEFPIEISSVEDMYRRVNLRNPTPPVAGLDGSGGFGSDTIEPDNYPDDLTNDKWFAFLHGFNVDGEAGRGWNAEVFKRMHQMGSRAKFIAVQWHGDTGSTDYQAGLINAFKTSELMADALDFASGDLTVAAHSLGNMVISNAIAYEGLSVNRYYLLNAATPMEAYDSGSSHDSPTTSGGNRIVHDDWKDYWTTTRDQRRVYSSYWHLLFNPANDHRAGLKWGGRFSSVNSVAYNFYSTGEDVVENAGNSETVLSNYYTIISNWLVSLAGVRGSGTHAWTSQEIVKGSSLVVGTRQAGWGFATGLALGYVGTSGPGGQGLVPMPPDQTDSTSVTDEEIAQFGLFYAFNNSNLHGPIDDANALTGVTSTQAQASALVDQSTQAGKDLMYELLGTAIPSRSYAAAANEVTAFNQPGEPSRNFDMALSTMRDGWPSGIDSGDGGVRWRHSDFKDIALRYVYPMYDKMIEVGELKQ